MKLKLNWKAIQDALFAQLKGAAVKAALKKLLGSAAMGGFNAWAVKFIIEVALEQIAIPIAKSLIISTGFTISVVGGKVIVEKMEQAENENNQTDYDNASDDGWN